MSVINLCVLRTPRTLSWCLSMIRSAGCASSAVAHGRWRSGLMWRERLALLTRGAARVGVVWRRRLSLAKARAAVLAKFRLLALSASSPARREPERGRYTADASSLLSRFDLLRVPFPPAPR